MLARRVTAVVILAAFLALAVLSFLGSPILSVIFILVAAVVLGHHALSLCPSCSNLHCAFNPRFGTCDDEAEKPFSDLPVNRTTVVPLLLAGPLAVIGAWLFSPALTAIVAGVALAAHTVFTRLTCRHCGNDCAGNCNERYRAWKKEAGGVS